MFLMRENVIGLLILVLLGALVVVKAKATGSILEKPEGGLILKVVNSYNLFSLLIVNPAAAILLIAGVFEINPGRSSIEMPALLLIWKTIGVVIYVTGHFIMAWALIRLGYNYQLGGSTPRLADKMVINGPYRFIRHPMYTAALAISLGLACLTQSWIFFAAFGIYLGLILSLIALEEKELQRAYEKQYLSYQQRSKKLIPLLY
jgi:protein-S-isoprenylcysteine O-methyltransferase Ste14